MTCGSTCVLRLLVGSAAVPDLAAQAINYLLARPEADTPATDDGPGATPVPDSVRSHLSRFRSADSRGAFMTPPAIRSAIYGTPSRTASTDRLTARGRPSLGTTGTSTKRANTAAADFLRQASEFGSPRSMKSSFSPQFTDGSADVITRDEAMEDAASDDGDFEGLENVRACCDGKHDVGA